LDYITTSLVCGPQIHLCLLCWYERVTGFHGYVSVLYRFFHIVNVSRTDALFDLFHLFKTMIQYDSMNVVAL